MPASVITATEPANPKSTSSGCAITTRTRSTPVRSSSSMVRSLAAPPSAPACATLVGVTTSPFSARELVGLLADDDRRAVFAALVLGATDLPPSGANQGWTCGGPRRQSNDSSTPASSCRATTARCTCWARRSRSRPGPRPNERREATSTTTRRPRSRVLRAFVRDGRLASIPTVHSKRLVVLDWLVAAVRTGTALLGADGEPDARAGARRHRRAAALPRRRRLLLARQGRVLAHRRKLRAAGRPPRGRRAGT